MAGGAAHRPTNAAVAVFQDRLRELNVARRDFDRLMAEVAAFTQAHAGRLTPITDRLSAAATL